MTDLDKNNETSCDQSFVAFLLSMDGKRLGVLSFNLGGLAWIGLNLTLGKNLLPFYQPCAYLSPGSFSLVFAPLLILALALACLAIKRGSLLPAALTLTFGWSLIASLIREFGS
ncbi:MAG: hypothetical protein JSS83_19425 [Cyanobacteria bacterium SZAS LIN-3]|nr:hypothetical protein [Cyanobacteria bacterium SZAS LIN-3]MBS2010345.1 hypothetical protein [Cyanobacteria bacterium SZAS TMP-1]